MERLLSEMLAPLLDKPSVGGMAVWVGLVSLVFWAPTLFPPRWRRMSAHITGYGFVSLLGCLWSLRVFTPPFELLEVTALALTAVWVWLETQSRKRSKDPSREEKEATYEPQNQSTKLLEERESNYSQSVQSQDLLNAVRVAMWATFSLIPLTRWI